MATSGPVVRLRASRRVSDSAASRGYLLQAVRQTRQSSQVPRSLNPPRVESPSQDRFDPFGQFTDLICCITVVSPFVPLSVPSFSSEKRPSFFLLFKPLPLPPSSLMPKIATSKTKFPPGWDVLKPTLDELDAKMRDGTSSPSSPSCF